MLRCVSLLISLVFLPTWSLEEAKACAETELTDQIGNRVPPSALLQIQRQHSRRDAREAQLVERKVQLPPNKWEGEKTARDRVSANATVAEIRLEMARRALSVIFDTGEDELSRQFTDKGEKTPSRKTDDGRTPSSKADDGRTPSSKKSDTGADVPPDVVHQEVQSGATADLNEDGYQIVATCCCPLEMSVFAERIINHFGFKVCNEGSLQGLVAWYYCANQTRSFQELADEALDAADGDCAWVGTESSCPTMSPNCPHFPDTAGHRRRICAHRHQENTGTTTEAPPSTNYKIRVNTHCGYYQSCGLDENNLYIGEGGHDYTNSTEPEDDCVATCDASEECKGFTYIQERHSCYFRRNVTCGVFQSEGNDCWSKPS